MTIFLESGLCCCCCFFRLFPYLLHVLSLPPLPPPSSQSAYSQSGWKPGKQFFLKNKISKSNVRLKTKTDSSVFVGLGWSNCGYKRIGGAGARANQIFNILLGPTRITAFLGLQRKKRVRFPINYSEKEAASLCCKEGKGEERGKRGCYYKFVEPMYVSRRLPTHNYAE